MQKGQNDTNQRQFYKKVHFVKFLTKTQNQNKNEEEWHTCTLLRE